MQTHISNEPQLVALLGERVRRYFPSEAIDHSGLWIDAVFQRVREAIRSGDCVAVSLACDLIDKDPHLPFGKLIKSGLSRQLRMSPQLLTAPQRQQVIDATLRLLALPHAPRELEDYAKLVSKLPVQEYVQRLALIDPLNAKCAKLQQYLLQRDVHAAPEA